ncbi:MAG TPA: ADP-ribosylglycohydrolase family protein, partial [Candidatus Babeliales bacterium]|nr:ADP-ribosylglycohydrolase family protein [Candidatus Babeliales bacterium]
MNFKKLFFLVSLFFFTGLNQLFAVPNHKKQRIISRIKKLVKKKTIKKKRKKKVLKKALKKKFLKKIKKKQKKNLKRSKLLKGKKELQQTSKLANLLKGRIEKIVMGAAIGDALGGITEFMSVDNIYKRYPGGLKTLSQLD